MARGTASGWARESRPPRSPGTQTGVSPPPLPLTLTRAFMAGAGGRAKRDPGHPTARDRGGAHAIRGKATATHTRESGQAGWVCHCPCQWAVPHLALWLSGNTIPLSIFSSGGGQARRGIPEQTLKEGVGGQSQPSHPASPSFLCHPESAGAVDTSYLQMRVRPCTAPPPHARRVPMDRAGGPMSPARVGASVAGMAPCCVPLCLAVTGATVDPPGWSADATQSRSPRSAAAQPGCALSAHTRVPAPAWLPPVRHTAAGASPQAWPTHVWMCVRDCWAGRQAP